MASQEKVRPARLAGLSVGAAYDIYRRFDELGLVLPPVNRQAIPDRIPNALDMKILERLRSCPTCTGDAFALCHQSSSSLGDCHRLGYLVGSWMPPCDEIEAAQFRFDDVDVKLLSAKLDGVGPFLTDDEISPERIQHASQALGLSEEAIRARILRMAPLGVVLRSSPT